VSESDAAAQKHDPFAALREPRFVLYTLSRTFGVTAQMLVQAVMAKHVYDITGTEISLGVLGLVRFFPSLGLSLVGGAAADTYNRRFIILACQVLTITSVALVAVASFGGSVQLGMIYGLALVLGISSSFEGPARQALLPNIVKQETFQNAVSLTSTFQGLGMVIGPALGGVILAVSDYAEAYSVFVGLAAVSMLGMTLLRYEIVRATGSRVSLAAIREGVSFVRQSPVLLGAMSLDMFAVVFGGVQALLPVYSEDILHVGDLGYGILYSSLEVGAVIAYLGMLFRPPILNTGKALVYSVLLYGVFTIAFGLSRSFMLSVFLYGLIGAADGVSVVMRSTTIQLATPDALRGRVSAVAQVFIGASNQVGAMESGFVAAITSATFAVVSGGVVAIGVSTAVAWRLRELFNYRIPRGETPMAEAAIEDAPVAAS
jgi:MFS family permease